MAINLIGNRPNVAIAKTSTPFSGMGLDVSKISIIYEVGTTLRSWNPASPFNAITESTAGVGYYIIPKIDLDLELHFAPPFPDGNCTGSDFEPATNIQTEIFV